jgi:mRNA interferase HigB
MPGTEARRSAAGRCRPADIAEHARHTDINTRRPDDANPEVAAFAVAAKARWANPAEIKRQFGGTVDFVGGNRVIFDLGGNKYRLVVHVSYTFGRVLAKFIGTHAEYDRVDPKTVSWRKK